MRGGRVIFVHNGYSGVDKEVFEIACTAKGAERGFRKDIFTPWVLAVLHHMSIS